MPNEDLLGFKYALAGQEVTVLPGPSWGDGQYVTVEITEPARTYRSVKQAELVRRHKDAGYQK